MTPTAAIGANSIPADKSNKRMKLEIAQVVMGLRKALAPDEQLLGFSRGRIAGGWRGKLNVGPEAFFAPFVNVGLTDRRVVLQHIHSISGAPSEILPHVFPLEEILDLEFTDIETFGAEPAGRIVLHLGEDQKFRIRVGGRAAFDCAMDMAAIYHSFTQARRVERPNPTSSHCERCSARLDEPVKFCPYCGAGQRKEDPGASPTGAEPRVETPSPGGPSADESEISEVLSQLEAAMAARSAGGETSTPDIDHPSPGPNRQCPND